MSLRLIGNVIVIFVLTPSGFINGYIDWLLSGNNDAQLLFSMEILYFPKTAIDELLLTIAVLFSLKSIEWLLYIYDIYNEETCAAVKAMLYMRRSLRSALELSSPQDILTPLPCETIVVEYVLLDGVYVELNKLPFI